MTRFFVFGSLMDEDVLQAVLKRPVAPSALRPATAIGFKRLRIEGASYPALVPAIGAATSGIVLERLNDADVARLARYEGRNYENAPIRVRYDDGGDAEVRYWRWIGKTPLLDTLWDYDEWLRTGKAALLAAAHGQRSATS